MGSWVWWHRGLGSWERCPQWCDKEWPTEAAEVHPPLILRASQTSPKSHGSLEPRAPHSLSFHLLASRNPPGQRTLRISMAPLKYRSLALIRVCLFQQIIYEALAQVPTFQLLLPWKMRLGRETRAILTPLSIPRLRIYLFPWSHPVWKGERCFLPTLSQPEAAKLEDFRETSSPSCRKVPSRSILIDLWTYVTGSLLCARSCIFQLSPRRYKKKTVPKEHIEEFPHQILVLIFDARVWSSDLTVLVTYGPTFISYAPTWGASLKATVVKNLPANTGDGKRPSLIPGSGWSFGGGHGNHSSILAWRIPRTEGPGRLQSLGLQRVGHDWSSLACTQTT